jgi:type VI secretion system protein ImpG
MAASGRDRLLELYATELAYLRERGTAFAQDHQAIAARLALSGRESADPHVERLIESFAFLTARLQQDLEDELPVITGALLGALYPQLAAPVPPMAIATFAPSAAGRKATTGVAIPKGTPLFAEAKDGPTCRFRTCFDVTLWPLEVRGASLVSPDEIAPPRGEARPAASKALVLRLGTRPGDPPIEKLEVDRLRFFLGGDRLNACRLYDLLFARRATAYVRSGGRALPARIAPAGFARDEDVLPYPENAHPGHRLLQEYFVFPDKFLFFDVAFTAPPAGDALRGDALEIVVLLEEPPPPSLVVRRDSFQLSSTPVINLFRKATEPIRLDQRTHEHRLVADARRERTAEIHTILRVLSTEPAERAPRVYEPFFSYVHRPERDRPRAFWHARRVPCARSGVPGTDMLLSLVDTAFHPADPPAEVVYAETLCTNRDLAEEIGEGARLQLERGGIAADAVLATKPTRPIPAPAGGEALWRLVSSLSIGHVSLADGPRPPSAADQTEPPDASRGEALREVLRAYLFEDDIAAEQQILAIRDVRLRAVVRRVGREAWRGFCAGTEITLTLDDAKLSGSSPILLSAVLSRFFALYAHINTFTELVLKKASDPAREWKRWPIMAGERTLL